MSNRKKGRYTQKIHVSVTKEMHDFVKLLAARHKTSINDVVRQSIREYLDAQEDVIASRSRLGRTVLRELEMMRHRLLKEMNQSSALVVSAVILQQVQQGAKGSEVLDQVTRLARRIGGHLPGAEG